MPYQDAYADAYPPDALPPPVASDFGDVYPVIAEKLQDSARRVEDAYFDRAIRSALRDARPKAVRALGTTGAAWYGSLGEDDREAVSEAVGLIVAAEMQPSLATGGAGGDLTSEATPEGAKRAFASAESLRQSWRDRAALLLASCSFAEDEPHAAMPTLFAANGPSRARAALRGRC